MKPEIYKADTLRTLMNKRKIVTMADLNLALGTNVSMTIFRKLQELSYVTSYSHRSKYYALTQNAKFDKQGLWAYQSVLFSQHETLIRTIEYFIEQSETGYSASELKDILRVEVKESLLRLFIKKKIYREKIFGHYVYFSTSSALKRKQLLFRKEQGQQQSVSSLMVPNFESKVLAHELKAAIILFFSILNEKQRRLYAGLEALKLGHGGEQYISDLLGIDPHTVAKGRDELLSRDIKNDQIRQKGGGRKAIEKKLLK